mgnify:CR=1 FL=1
MCLSSHRAQIKVQGSDSYVNIPDVGFGISQVLPVIVELFYAPKNSIIFIECMRLQSLIPLPYIPTEAQKP